EPETNLLPEEYAGVWLEPSRSEGVRGRINLDSMEISISMKNLEMKTQIEKTKCEVKATQATGCYSCAKGAHINATCLSYKASAIAHVECGEFSFSLKCQEKQKAIEERIYIYTNTIMLNKTCNVSCPETTGHVSIHGILDAPAEGDIEIDEAYRIKTNINSTFWDETTSGILKSAYSYYSRIKGTLQFAAQNYVLLFTLIIIAGLGVILMNCMPLALCVVQPVLCVVTRTIRLLRLIIGSTTRTRRRNSNRTNDYI
ncbi:MAG TPA: hypothetical protein VFV08_03890, partial [Puia sp.]|nr:hypothetical protein [Puia sp.]